MSREDPSPPQPATTPAGGACFHNCAPGQCRPECSLQVITRLLTDSAHLTANQSDLLLDLHQLLCLRSDATSALQLFCEIREHIEARHYLSIYRLRRWFENHLLAELISQSGQKLTVPIRLKHSSFEAVCRQCLCAGLHANFEQPPTIAFVYRPLTTRPSGSQPVP